MGFSAAEWCDDPAHCGPATSIPTTSTQSSSGEERPSTTRDHPFTVQYRMLRADAELVWVRDEAVPDPPRACVGSRSIRA